MKLLSAKNRKHREVRSAKRFAGHVLPLESRLLMCAEHAAGHLPENLGTFGLVHRTPAPATTVTSTSTSVAAFSSPLSSIPALNSNPSPTAKIYLDFNGEPT